MDSFVAKRMLKSISRCEARKIKIGKPCTQFLSQFFEIKSENPVEDTKIYLTSLERNLREGLELSSMQKRQLEWWCSHFEQVERLSLEKRKKRQERMNRNGKNRKVGSIISDQDPYEE